jgi:hypothetical protein
VKATSRTDIVRQRLAHQFVYLVTSSAGCGCAFDPKTGASDDDHVLTDEFRRAVAEYLSIVIANGPVQFLGVWDGDQTLPLTRIGRVSPEAALAESFSSGRPTLLEVGPPPSH